MPKKLFVFLTPISLLFFFALSLGHSAEDPKFFNARKRMVEKDLRGRDITDHKVLEVMGRIPRHLFVNPSLQSQAYTDHPLPIGEGQTISQPYIVALMTQWAEVKAGDKVLEIGTGSGYQAAVLAELADQVFTIELVPELGRTAAAALKDAGYARVHTRIGDGYQGWPEEAPFDAVLVTATAPEIPPALAVQLKEGGRLVIPIGTPGRVQQLNKFRKVGEKLQNEARLPVLFVPLVKPGAQKEGR
jgi:protein-L-isoaspartate(D-aspartate) O-methyltransferase